MRVTTALIYDKGVFSIQSQTGKLLHTQQQVSTGRRILTPADDPIASARALELRQSKSVNEQFTFNQGYANDNLRLVENKLTGAGDILHYVRERAVQAGNGTLLPEDLGYLAEDMRRQFEALTSIANAQDGLGEYLFSGYKADAKPFEGNISNLTYQGDQGSRSIQVSATRYMPVSFAGDAVFDRARYVDPYKVADNDALYSFKALKNSGTADPLTVRLDAATVPLDVANQGRRYVVNYAETTPGDPTTGAYQIQEIIPGLAQRVAVATGLAPGSTHTFNGIEIDLPAHVPSALNPSDPGNIENGDSFELFVASTNTFTNFALFVSSLEDSGDVGQAGGVAFALENLDYGMENLSKLRAQAGSQMVELENLKNVGSDLNLQYAQAISRQEDVDYAKAISDLTLQQTFLQAAQQSFAKTSNLSLFNYLR
jgi:flagellar hook-associated protein 3 FlgL